MGARLPWEPFPTKEPDPKGPDALHAIVYRAAVAGADAFRGVRMALRREGGVLRVGNRFVPDGRYREVGFLAAGRAAGSMAMGVLSVLGERVTQGFVAGPSPAPPEVPFQGVQIPPVWGGAPAAAEVVNAAQEIASGLREADLFLVLLSPGALTALALPPPGFAADDFSRWLQDAHQRGATGREVGLLARVLGTGGVGGNLVPSTTKCDVETWIVDRGEGAGLVGGGPTRPEAAGEREAARATAERLGILSTLPSPARELLRPGGAPVARQPASNRSPVVVAGPTDALRAAADAAFDKGWTSRLAAVRLDGRADAAASTFLTRSEEIVQAEGPGLAARPKGLLAFAMTTLDLPEGVDEDGELHRFLAAARTAIRRREMSVGLFRTAGTIARESGPSGAVVGAPLDPTSGGSSGEERPVDMRGGVTDVGLLAVALWAGSGPRESTAGPPTSRGGPRPGPLRSTA